MSPNASPSPRWYLHRVDSSAPLGSFHNPLPPSASASSDVASAPLGQKTIEPVKAGDLDLEEAIEAITLSDDEDEPLTAIPWRRSWSPTPTERRRKTYMSGAINEDIVSPTRRVSFTNQARMIKGDDGWEQEVPLNDDEAYTDVPDWAVRRRRSPKPSCTCPVHHVPQNQYPTSFRDTHHTSLFPPPPPPKTIPQPRSYTYTIPGAWPSSSSSDSPFLKTHQLPTAPAHTMASSSHEPHTQQQQACGCGAGSYTNYHPQDAYSPGHYGSCTGNSNACHQNSSDTSTSGQNPVGQNPSQGNTNTPPTYHHRQSSGSNGQCTCHTHSHNVPPVNKPNMSTYDHYPNTHQHLQPANHQSQPQSPPPLQPRSHHQRSRSTTPIDHPLCVLCSDRFGEIKAGAGLWFCGPCWKECEGDGR